MTAAVAPQLDRTYRVFLSYARDDRPFAERVVRILADGHGLHVFTNDMTRPGEDWRERLRQEVSTCDVFMVVGSPRSGTSASVLQELGGAWALDKPIVVVSPERGRTWLPPVSTKAMEVVSLVELETPGILDDLLARVAPPKARGH